METELLIFGRPRWSHRHAWADSEFLRQVARGLYALEYYRDCGGCGRKERYAEAPTALRRDMTPEEVERLATYWYGPLEFQLFGARLLTAD